METDEKKSGKSVSWKRRILRWLLTAAVVLLLALAAFVLSVPYLLTHVPIPELEFDLSPRIKGKLAELVESKKATVDLDIRRGKPDGFRVRAKGRLLDWRYTATANVRFGFIRADGDLRLSLDGTDWMLYADFSGTGAKDWRFNANVKEREISRDDPVLASVLSRLGSPMTKDLAFSGSFSLDAEGSCTPKRPVPAWSARGGVKNLDASLVTPGGTPVEISALRLRFGVDAIADHRDIAPMFPRADSVTAAGFVLSNAFASVRATERSYLVTEAGADCCGGELRLYSLFLDPEKLSAGATVFADGIDAGQVLSRLAYFRGQASGRLHGKMPFFLKDGRELHIKNTYLFSTPGETGKMRIDDPKPILDNLALGGVPEAERGNLAKVLADLDYNVLKIELARGEDGEDSTLGIKIEGSATRGNTTVPVNLNIAFHGDVDEIVNLGLKFKRHTGKEKQK